MEPGERAYRQAMVAELVFPDLDLLRALAEEPAPWRSRVLAFRSPEVAAEEPDLLSNESR
jgi:hypothetical protein